MKKRNTENYSLNLIGQRFGRLTVVARAEDKIDPKSGKHKSCWVCDCDCGNEKIVIGAILTFLKMEKVILLDIGDRKQLKIIFLIKIYGLLQIVINIEG